MIINHIKLNDYFKNAIVVMGDFNSVPSETPIKLLKESLDDSFNEIHQKKPFGTFNGFDLKSKLTSRIDYIFTKNLEVNGVGYRASLKGKQLRNPFSASTVCGITIMTNPLKPPRLFAFLSKVEKS